MYRISLFVFAAIIPIETQAQDLRDLIKGKWQLCAEQPIPEGAKVITLVKGGNAKCEEWEATGKEIEWRFKEDGQIGFSETSLDQASLSTASGYFGRWKVREKKKTLTITWEKGKVTVYDAKEISKERLLLVKKVD